VFPESVSDRPAPDLFDLSPDPAILLGPDGARLRANRAFARAFPHAVSGARPPWGRVSPPAFVDGERRFEAAAPDGRRYEWRETRLADGSSLAVARDVSERVEAADTAARAKTMLFATLTHELRTPLNGILGMYEVLAQTQRAPAEREYLQAIRHSGEHLLSLITDILDYARLDADSFRLEERVFDPEEVLQSVAELMSTKAKEKGLELCVKIEANAPTRVAGDEGRLKQILFNLVGNALKFTATGAVALEVRAAAPLGPRAVGPTRLRFTVRDTGPGVPIEMQMQVFEEFVQVDSSHARKFGGAGLGLAIVRKLARMMGGEAGLENAPGVGAAFWVELPLTALLREPIDTRDLAGLRVLVATPTAMLGRAIGHALALHGAEIEIAHDPSGFAAAAPADVVLLDDALARGAVAPFAAKGAPIVIMAAQEERAVLAQYRDAGVRHYLVKPLRRLSLVQRVLAAADEGNEQGAAPDERAAPAAAAPQTPARVLMAEDNPVNALIARTLLTRAGCLVDVVEDGEQAVRAAAEGAYDIVFLDLRMPVLDGLDAARRIRALPGPASRLPLIALTADAGTEERAVALGAGMDDFITKPIEPARLSAVLARFTGPSNSAKVAAA
jgi:signal transduction histidine kinase/CheY-like chemotaxis protein